MSDIRGAGPGSADAGWDVLVLEASDAPGGAVRSAGITAPGFVDDLAGDTLS